MNFFALQNSIVRKQKGWNYPCSLNRIISITAIQSSDRCLVDLTGVPKPVNTTQQQQVYSTLTPLVGVDSIIHDPLNPSPNLLRNALLRHDLEKDKSIQNKASVRPSLPDYKPFALNDCLFSNHNKPILRGWYATREEPRWSPCQSLFGGRAGRHLGVDLAAMAGTLILSPVSGYADFNPLGKDIKRGNHIFLFSHGDIPSGVFLCHLQDYVGNYPRYVQAGDPIATVGFSGITLYDGAPNFFGKFDTHLHLEVVTEKGHQDPLSFLNLSPLYAEDKRCFFPANPLQLSVRNPHPLLDQERGTISTLSTT